MEVTSTICKMKDGRLTSGALAFLYRRSEGVEESASIEDLSLNAMRAKWDEWQRFRIVARFTVAGFDDTLVALGETCWRVPDECVLERARKDFECINRRRVSTVNGKKIRGKHTLVSVTVEEVKPAEGGDK
jgi:hypothetical protein